jgi:hypothetical protein
VVVASSATTALFAGLSRIAGVVSGVGFPAPVHVPREGFRCVGCCFVASAISAAEG